MMMKSLAASSSIIVLFLAIPAGGAELTFDLNDAADKLAKRITQIIPNERTVFVRAFSVFRQGDDLDVTAKLVERLEKVYTIKQGGAEVTGKIKRNPLDQKKPVVGFTIDGEVITSEGEEFGFEIDIKNREQAIPKTEDTGEVAKPPIPGAKPPKKDPVVFVSQGRHRVQPSRTSPYSAEILVESRTGKLETRKLIRDGKVLRAQLNQGDIYAVRVRNTTAYAAAVSIYIDGLSRFVMADSEADKKLVDIVLPRATRDIPGYYRDSENVDAFQVGGYSESVVAKLLPKSVDVGVITITFAAAWKPGEKEPPFEKGDSGLDVVSVNATKRGPPRKDKTQKGVWEIGRTRAVIKIRY